MSVINTNMTWNYCLCEYAARRMKIDGGGNIVFVNSNTAYRAIPNRIAYQASKSGQLGMMRGLAFDLGTYNIRVNAVLPGMIRTDRWIKLRNSIKMSHHAIRRSGMWQQVRMLLMQMSILPQMHQIPPGQNLWLTAEI